MLTMINRKFHISELQHDPQAYAAAQLVDRHFGFRDNGKVTAIDIWKARWALKDLAHLEKRNQRAASPLRDLRPHEIELLRSQLDKLAEMTHGPLPQRRRDFATSLNYRLIAKPAVQECAKLIAENLGQRKGKEDNDVNLAELAEAEIVLAKLTSGELTQENPKLAETLSKSGAFTAENIAEIASFMRDGVGPLLRHGPLTINGRDFTDVFRIPLPDTEKGEGESHSTIAYNKAIRETELMLQNASYDRIYVRGYDDTLYVALNHRRMGLSGEGSLENIKEGYAAHLPSADGTTQDAGRVVEVVDINNSLYEATIAFYKRPLVAALETMYEKGKDLMDKRGRAAADRAIDVVEKERTLKSAEVPGALKALAPLATALSVVGLSYFQLPLVAYTLVATGAGLSGANVVNAMRRDSDLRPLYQAIGVAVNVPRRVRT
jgi:hypothetical protein